MGLASVNDTLKYSESYGDGYYVGTVIDNNDPLGIGRVKANVPGLFDPSKGDVPWIGPLKDSPFGYGTSTTGPYGVYGAPQVNSQIKVELQKGDPHNALYTPIPTKPNANPAFANPLIWGFQDPSGNQLLVNMQTGTWLWTHSSGDTIQYDSSGDRTTLVKGNSTETVNGGLNLTVVGSANINIQQNAQVTVGGSLNCQVSGNATYSAALHTFDGPVVMSKTLAVAEDITDNTSLGNSGTIREFRTDYNEHNHAVQEVQTGGSTVVSQPPDPQVPNP